MTPLEIRLALLDNGFVPTPVSGKIPILTLLEHLISVID